MRVVALLGTLAAGLAGAALHSGLEDPWQMVGLAAALGLVALGVLQAIRPMRNLGAAMLVLLAATAVIPPGAGTLPRVPVATFGFALALGAMAIASTMEPGLASRWSWASLATSMAWGMAPIVLVMALVFFGPDRLALLAERGLAYPLMAGALVVVFAWSWAAWRSKPEVDQP